MCSLLHPEKYLWENLEFEGAIFVPGVESKNDQHLDLSEVKLKHKISRDRLHFTCFIVLDLYHYFSIFSVPVSRLQNLLKQE